MVCALPILELVFPMVLLCVTRLMIVLFSLVLMRLYAGRLTKEVLLTNTRKLKVENIHRRLFILMILCAVATAGKAFDISLNNKYHTQQEIQRLLKY